MAKGIFWHILRHLSLFNVSIRNIVCLSEVLIHKFIFANFKTEKFKQWINTFECQLCVKRMKDAVLGRDFKILNEMQNNSLPCLADPDAFPAVCSLCLRGTDLLSLSFMSLSLKPGTDMYLWRGNFLVGLTKVVPNPVESLLLNRFRSSYELIQITN